MATKKKAKVKKLPKTPKKKTDAQLKKELDRVFSIYIRQKYMDDNGMVSCVTCGVRKHWTEMQNGHYISRTYLATRFLESNCHPQDVGCNVFKHGNYPAYAQFMIRQYGVEHLDWLDREKNKITKYFPYAEKIEEIKSKII